MGKSYSTDVRVAGSYLLDEDRFFSETKIPTCIFSSYKNVCRHSSLDAFTSFSKQVSKPITIDVPFKLF